LIFIFRFTYKRILKLAQKSIRK